MLHQLDRLPLWQLYNIGYYITVGIFCRPCWKKHSQNDHIDHAGVEDISADVLYFVVIFCILITPTNEPKYFANEQQDCHCLYVGLRRSRVGSLKSRPKDKYSLGAKKINVKSNDQTWWRVAPCLRAMASSVCGHSAAPISCPILSSIY